MIDVIQESISYESVKRKQGCSPHRICFATTHANALKRSGGNYIGTFNVPFDDSINPIFSAATSLKLFQNNNKHGGIWRSIRSEDEYSTIEQFVNNNRDIVFLRDTLSLSIALSNHSDDNGVRTVVGELEYSAKYQNSRDAVTKLSKMCVDICQRLPYYNSCKILCAVPSSSKGQVSLPGKIAANVAGALGALDISSRLFWQNDKKSVKELSLDEKWAALENAELLVDQNLLNSEVILVDDMYQSGTTIQYIAMKLLDAGASHVFGLTMVKARRNTDNR